MGVHTNGVKNFVLHLKECELRYDVIVLLDFLMSLLYPVDGGVC